MDVLRAELKIEGGIDARRIDEQRLLVIQIVRVRAGPGVRVSEREEISFALLVAELANQKQVMPRICQPIVSGPLELVLASLLIARFRAEVLDVAVGDVGDRRLAECAL